MSPPQATFCMFWGITSSYPRRVQQSFFFDNKHKKNHLTDLLLLLLYSTMNYRPDTTETNLCPRAPRGRHGRHRLILVLSSSRSPTPGEDSPIPRCARGLLMVHEFLVVHISG